MLNKNRKWKNERELQEAILREKAKGTSDLEIGKKYGATFRFIERLITRLQGVNVSSLKTAKRVKTLYPKDFKEEKTTVWSFKKRGNWATHSGEYRGNWSPYIPRNVILKYSREGEAVLDYFCGAGTTAVEAKLLGRRYIAFDINDGAIKKAKENLDFEAEPKQKIPFSANLKPGQIYEPELSVRDARDLSFLRKDSVDLICAHPPYADIIHYTDSKESDLSFFGIDEFLNEMSKVAKESHRVLKPGRQCAILIGDTRKKRHVIPLGFKLINVYLDAGFRLRELIIKRQHNCKTTGFWYANSLKYNFLLLAHEYLPIFEKPIVPTFSSGRDKLEGYGMGVPALQWPMLKKKVDSYETTTVWIFPDKDFEERLNRNVIHRYSDGKVYPTITFVSQSKNEKNFGKKRERKIGKLLFIKSPFLGNNPSSLNIKFYLQQMKEIVFQKLPKISEGGFIVIQTQDVRVGGYIEPLATRLVDVLIYDKLWLKEIIIITQESSNSNVQNSEDYLTITHQYLLVYEVRR